MIICSCNVLSDGDVRALLAAQTAVRTAQVFRELGCAPQCGRCTRSIRDIVDGAEPACDRRG
jgi:bacterioferritin-associated ferredoxin